MLESQMGETSLKIYKEAAVSIRKSVLAYLLSIKRMQQHIMKMEERRKKCDMTEHVIKNIVTKINLACMNFVYRISSVFKIRASGARAILLLAAVIQSHLDRQLKQSGKHLNTLTVFKYSAAKWNG